MYGVLLLAVVAVVALVLNPILAIVLIALAAVAGGMLAGGKVLKDGKVGTGPGPAGVPTTADASYDPVDQPGGPTPR